MKNVPVPAGISKEAEKEFLSNFAALTKSTGRLMLFAGDQKVEHLNNDFYGKGISEDDSNPLHLFEIANKAKIGVFATQLGLIAKYGREFPKIPYLVKINSKTNLVKTKQKDPLSFEWYHLDQIIEFKKNSGLNILGIGYTVYLGSEYEAEMLHQAAQIIYQAHQHGLVSVIWCYPRGKAVANEKDPHLIAGAAGVAAALGADFVKVNFPQGKNIDPIKSLKEAVAAAGKTKLVCAGGSSTDPKKFLQRLHNQIHVAGTAGNATGRNIHQKSLTEAIRFTNAIYAITIENKSVDEALRIYHQR